MSSGALSLFYRRGPQRHSGAVIPQILWHLYLISPEHRRASQEPYICWGTKQPVSGPREKGLIQRWASRGQDVIVCSSSVVRDGSISDAAEGGSRSQKAVCYRQIQPNQTESMQCPCHTHEQLESTLISIQFPDYILFCFLFIQDFQAV